MSKMIVIVFAVLVAVGRLTIETRHDLPTWQLSYEAFAHLFVGGLIGAALVSRASIYWWAAGLLTVWEVICFLWL